MLNRKINQNFLNFVTFEGLQEKSAFFKISAETSEARAFLNIFLRFLGLGGSFSYKNFCYKKNVYCY